MANATARDVDPRLDQYRVELTGYCYRMLGGAFDAEDAVQETMVRAWRAFDRFEGRSSVRTWLYRIATNVCFDLLDGRRRREQPIDLGPASTAALAPGPAREPDAWVEPMPTARVLATAGDPAELAVSRETVRLAFVAALQHLPPRQRAVLILRDVLRLSAIETAELLDTSVASANSALQRARATLEAHHLEPDQRGAPSVAPRDEALLARYVDAFERYDIDAFVALLHDDAVHSMPPYEMWMQGHAEIAAFMLGPGRDCRGSRLVATEANGMPAFGQYRPSGPGGCHEPWSLQLLDLRAGRLAGVTYFLDTAALFPLFDLPATLSS